MNQITPTSDYNGALEGLAPLKPRAADRVGTPPAQPADKDAKPAQTPRAAADPQGSVAATSGLSENDLRMIRKTLLSGDAALARRSDVGELYSRMVKLFETLNKGVGEMYVAKAETDRAALSERIDGLEDAVNRMEGALRIELEPVLRQTMAQVVAEQAGARPRGSRRGLLMVLLLGAGLTLGAVFHAPLSTAATAIVSKMETVVSKINPNWEK
jgi:hypothetical protein